MSSSTTVYDVLILGAGSSGLSAALSLDDHNIANPDKSINFHILEPRDRVGGRLYTVTLPLPGSPKIDLGGAYVGPEQFRLQRLFKRFNIPTRFVSDRGDTAYADNGVSKRCSSDIPPFSLPQKTEFIRLFVETETLLLRYNDSPYPAEFDCETVHAWLNRISIPGDAKDLYENCVRSLVAVEAYEISLRCWLESLQSAGSFERALGQANGGQERTTIGGFQQLPQKIQQEIERNGPKITFNADPIEIDWSSPDSIRVLTRSGAIFHSKRIILAFSPVLYRRILFKPSLPLPHAEFTRRMINGRCIKTWFIFRSPHWRASGYNGILLSNNGPICFSYEDIRDSDTSVPPFYALMGFILGDHVLQYGSLSLEQRKQAILKQYKIAFNWPDIEQHVVHYEEFNWNQEEYSQGAFSAATLPGGLNYSDCMAESIDDRILFAGTELATKWNGYVEGAVETGQRAAWNIRKAMGYLEAGDEQSFPMLFSSEDNILWPSKPIPPPNWLMRCVPTGKTVQRLIQIVAGAAIAGTVLFTWKSVSKRGSTGWRYASN